MPTIHYVLAVDPGARETGIITATGPDPGHLTLTMALVVVRRGGETLDVDPRYLHEITTAMHALLDETPHGTTALLAVEGVTRPNAHHHGKLSFIDPSGLLATAITFGAITGDHWPCPLIAVRPGANGSGPAALYPTRIRIPAGGKGGDRARHLRSAWDVAISGLRDHRQASRPPRRTLSG
jgi:hypothetical protein